MIKILAIDDKQSNLVVFTALFSKAFPNAHVITALSGREGIEKAIVERPDVILIDLVMPIMDGIETCKILKENDSLKQIPVIMITAAKTDSKTRTKALKLGVQSFLSKPIDEAEMVAQVSSMIQLKKPENKVLPENEQIKEQQCLRTHELEDELRKISHAVEQSPASIVITDIDGSIVYCNPKVCELTGYSIGELLGKNPRIFQSGKTPKETYKNLWDTLTSVREWRGELLNKKKNGELYWESVSISPIHDADNKIINFMAVKEDVTERKRMIERLVEVKKQAEESDRLKSAFLANLSHEIRTPMNGILGFSSLLKEPNLTGKDQQKYIAIIEQSGHRMLNTINELIDISRIESGQMKVLISETNINKQIESIYSFFKPVVEGKGMKFSFKNKLSDKAASIRTDSQKLNTILSTLVDNAIKYSEKGSIALGYEKKGRYIEFFVKDTGIGISQEQKEIIFESFRQGSESLTRNYEGSGLGLAISKAYVEMLHGKIWFKSDRDSKSEGNLPAGKSGGSTFYFTIPYNAVMKEKIAMKRIVSADGKDKQIP